MYKNSFSVISARIHCFTVAVYNVTSSFGCSLFGGCHRICKKIMSLWCQNKCLTIVCNVNTDITVCMYWQVRWWRLRRYLTTMLSGWVLQTKDTKAYTGYLTIVILKLPVAYDNLLFICACSAVVLFIIWLFRFLPFSFLFSWFHSFSHITVSSHYGGLH